MPKTKITSLFLKYSDFFRDMISLYYPLTNSQLSNFKDLLNWECISLNENIKWSYEILNNFKNSFDWCKLSGNSSVFKDMSLIDDFNDFIDWFGKENWCGDTIVNNSGIYWSMEAIDKYADKINFEKLSESIYDNVQWSEELLDKYKDKWNWHELANNQNVPWNICWFEKYLDKSYLDYWGVKNNENLITLEFIEKYQQYLDWYNICLNPKLPWQEENLLEKWKDNIDWKGIALNTYFFETDKDFFQKHYDIWIQDKQAYFGCFSRNKAFPWTKELIDTYKEDIDWNFLCRNEGVEWDKAMIAYFKEYIDWNELCHNKSVVWDESMIDYFKDFVQWGGWKSCELYSAEGEFISSTGGFKFENGLINNISTPWTIDFLLKYEDKLDFKAYEVWRHETTIWEKFFAPYVNDELIDIVAESINTAILCKQERYDDMLDKNEFLQKMVNELSLELE